MVFKEIISYQQFFNMLPTDWRDSILPFWEAYKKTTKCYLLLEDEKPVAGGLVFSECPPDMTYAKEETEMWFKNGYFYLGFIYVLEEKRGKNLGSIWLSNLKNMLPKQKYWLTIEDLSLDEFYVKNGFQQIKILNNDDHQEALYSYEPV